MIFAQQIDYKEGGDPRCSAALNVFFSVIMKFTAVLTALFAATAVASPVMPPNRGNGRFLVKRFACPLDPEQCVIHCKDIGKSDGSCSGFLKSECVCN
jgi:hypothetical protein